MEQIVQPEKKAINTIKVRGDIDPLNITKTDSQFTIEGDQHTTWTDNGTFTESELKAQVEPWLTSLFQSEHLSLLVGSGLSVSVLHEAGCESDTGMQCPEFESPYYQTVKKFSEQVSTKANRGEPNTEDYLRVMSDLLRGFEILKHKEKAEHDTVDYDTDYTAFGTCHLKVINDFANGILKGEQKLITESKKLGAAVEVLVKFLMCFSSRTGTRDRLNLFTTNYDRMLELGAELAGIHLLDRFVGSLFPIFRSSRLDLDMHYNPPGIRGEPRYLEGVVRFTKLHGSIDWIEKDNDIHRIGLPFGATSIDPFLSAASIASDASKVMIYPNASKDRETSEYPYVELFRDFASALCRPNSTIVTYGYGFGDDHINRVIRDMLTIPSTHLVILSYDEANGRIMQNYEAMKSHSSQISMLIGHDVANIAALTKVYLPKPSIDQTTLRMAELIEKRIPAQPKPKKENDIVQKTAVDPLRPFQEGEF
jgi:hypothetical protein